jgi:predicted outer membrane repeat protein
MDRMSTPRHGHRERRTAAAVLLGVVGLLVAASPAAANSYHDFLCRIPYGPSAGRAAPVDDVTYATGGTYVFAGNSCAGGGALYASMDGEVSHPYGSGASDAFSAPAGLTIGGFTLWRYEADTAVQPYGAPVSNLDYSPGPPSVQGLCAQSLGCASRGTPNSAFDPSNAVGVGSLSGVTQIQWSAACGGGPGGECPASGGGTLSSQYNVYAADIDLVDDTPPAVSGVSGPLVAGGTLAGSQAVSFNASDGQSGVYGGSLLVDGHTLVSQILDTNGGACQSLNVTNDGQRSFEHAQPCKGAVSGNLTLNTNLLTAGQHSLELIVDDAAGNQTIAYNATITTSGPPQVGVNGSINGRGPHVANGNPCAGEALELVVNGRRRPPLVTYGKTVTVRGVLHCGTVPIRGARVLIATLGGPGSAAIASSVQSALDGSFSYKVPAGPDRQLRFSYTAYSDDPAPSASATAAILIRPRIKLKIRPHRSSNGHSIYWTGTVTGGPYPRQGVTLDVEVQEGRSWRIFDQVVARKGRFRYSYRFHATGEPTTYTFRVALPASGSGGYPYTPGASNSINVHVNP